MKIPKNMSKEDVLATIDIVINRMAHKYTFHGYDIDDIKQESFIICYDALERYDEKRPLENFLSVNLSNRLKNFIRDNNFTKCSEQKRKAMLHQQMPSCDVVSNKKEVGIDISEISEIIDSKLPVHYRADYLKIINDVYVNKNRKQEILDYIKDILSDYEDDDA